VGYGLADGYLLSRPYLDLEAPSLRPLALITAVVVVLTVVAVALTAHPAAKTKPGPRRVPPRQPGNPLEPPPPHPRLLNRGSPGPSAGRSPT